MKDTEKMQKIVIIAIVIASILLVSLIVMFINAKQKASENPILESTGTQMGKTAEEAKKESEESSLDTDNENYETAKLISNSDEDEEKQDEANSENPEETLASDEIQNVEVKEVKKEKEIETDKQISKETSSKEITFSSPVSGEIIKGFARDSLVYSNTLKEWITHNGIDIKADKTTVVSSSADGTIQAIKNDPRYGLTVIINHNDGYQTIYSNLLTAEFVVEGEKVKKGQSIGSVGNTASFEILDDPHLHFELLRNGEYLDPTIYINFE